MKRLACLLLLLAAAAAAHPGHEYDAMQAETPDGILFLTFEAPVVKAGRLLPVVVEHAPYAPDHARASRTLEMHLVAPDGSRHEAPLAPDGRAWRGNASFAVEGAWTARVRHVEQDETTSFPVRVYPASAYHVEAPRLRYEILHARTPERIPVAFVDDGTNRPAAHATDASALLARWTENRTVRQGEVEVALARAGEGAWEMGSTFPEPGEYEIRFASGSLGLGYDDLPPFWLQVRDGTHGAEEERRVPAAAGGLLFAVLALAAARADRPG